MSTDLFDSPTTPIPRDRWGRPLVTPPDGGKPVGYTRCTTFVDCLDDKYNLQKWQQRMVAVGLVDRPDLVLAVAAHRHNKKELDSLTKSALDAAQAGAAATTGTAIHALTERIDRGEELPLIPEAYLADLDAYRHATAGLEVLAIEQFTVLDDERVGGTPDRVVRYRGKAYIADVKTGSVDFGAMKIAMQLAVYARSTPYNHDTNTRHPYPADVDTSRGIVIHLPAGTGTCELRWIDLDAGWSAVQVAAQVRRWRSYKDWYRPFAAPGTGTTLDPAAEGADAELDAWGEQISRAQTVEEVRRLYEQAVASGVDGETLLPDCLRRKDELQEAA
jgi:hypothetical protein